MVPAILESADGCQASEKPLRLWGVPVKWASLVLLTFVTTWTIFSIKLARSSSQEYRNSSVVLFTELFKLALSLAYTIQNNLIFLSVDFLSAAVQQVTYQLKMLSVISASDAAQGQFASQLWAPGTTGATRAFMGFLAALGACFASGFGGVFMEMVLKGSATSIWLRNAQLAIFGASTAAWVVFQEGHEAPLVHGYTFWVWLMAFTVASGGMLVAAVLKYADNILRQFSTAISVILTTALSALVLEDITLDMMFAAGTVLTIGATFMYSGMLDDFLPKWMQ
ncbi:unnamed protein product [Durusdinium trenchii]|uniref:Uncharacterized protein n=1 Tax=Durusdinium trenchii TaxID=1381693 RepID=A0ABP0MXY8_9DINO